MKIEMKDLQKITNKIFELLAEYEIDSVDINVDYYWKIPKQETYDPTKEPDNLLLGQLSFDWDDLQEIIESDEFVVNYSFQNLSSIFKAVGDKLAV